MLTLANRLLNSGGAPIEFVGSVDDFLSGDPLTMPLNGTWANGTDSSLAEGDLVIVLWGLNETQGGFSITDSGWTYVGSEASNDSYDTTLAVAYKIMGPSPDTSVTLDIGNSANCNAVAIAFRNVNQADPTDSVSPVSADGVNSAIPNPPGVTVNTAGAVVVAMGSSNAGGSNTNFTAPWDYSNMQARGGAYQQTGVCLRQVGSSGSENPPAFGGGSATTGGAWSAWTMVVLPKSPAKALVT